MHLLVRGDHALDRDPEVQAAQQGADQGVGLLSQLGLAHFAVQRRLRQLQLHPAVRDLIGLFAQHAGDSFACGSLSGTQHFVLSVRPGPGDRRPARSAVPPGRAAFVDSCLPANVIERDQAR